MEINKAIDLLDNLIGMVDDNQENDYDTAFHMTIDALKAQENKQLNSDSVDTISRAAAINAHCELCGDRGACNCDICPDVEVFRLIPSQPETHEKRTETHACDCIDRQAAISVIAKWMLEYGGEGEERERNALKQAAEEIKELPPAQPEVLACGEGELIAQPEIVHCKDCKHYIKSESYCDYLGITISDHDFCSYAERREDGQY